MKFIKAAELWVPDNDTHFSDMGAKMRRYQHDRIETAIEYTTKKRIAVDVGAHIGILSLKLARYFDQVMAFEPHPDNFECLKRNTEKVSNIQIFNAALSDSSRPARLLSKKDGNSGNRWMAEHGDVEVKCIPLDSLKLDCMDLIKIDVQGYEWYVISGAYNTIKYCRPVCVIEIEKLPPKISFRRTAKQAITDLKSMGATEVARVGVDRIIAFEQLDSASENFSKYEDRGDYHWQKYRSAQKLIETVDLVTKESKRMARQNGKSGRILDVGCGDGLLTHKMGAIGMDKDATAIELCRQHGVEAFQADIIDLAKLDRFDAVTMFDVFEHLYDQTQVLSDVAKITDLLMIVNPEPEEDAEPFGHKHFHAREFTADELEDFAERCGWQCVYRYRLDENTRLPKTFMAFIHGQ